MGKASIKGKGLRTALFPKDTDKLVSAKDRPVDGSETFDPELAGFQRVQIRVSAENYEWLKGRAAETGTSMSAVASIMVADAIKKQRQEA
jgi:hypothetical protein